MIAQKNRYIFGGILIGLIILITIGIGMLALLLDELGEEGHDIAYFALYIIFTTSWSRG